ncbi:MAG: hypothetical protein AAF414_10370 [Pseudomonadota bacterium]
MSKRGWITSGACALLSLTAVEANAQAQATDEMARKLVTALERYIDNRLLEPNPGWVLEQDDRIEVVPAGDYYAGSIPPGRLLMLGDEFGWVWTIDEPLEFDLRIDEGGWYHVDFNVPSSIQIAQYRGLSLSENEPSSEIDFEATATIGSQVGTVLIVPDYEQTLDFEIIWNDVEVTFEGLEDTITLGRFSALQTAPADGAELDDLSIERTFDLANLAIDTGRGSRMELDTATVISTWAGFDMPAFYEFFAAADPLFSLLQAEPDDPEPYRLLRNVLANTPNLFNEVTGEIGLKGLRIREPAGNVDLEEISVGFNLEGLSGNSADLALSFRLADLQLGPQVPNRDLIPTNAGYDIRANDLPTEALYGWLDDFLATVPSLGPDIALPASLFSLYEDLAGTGAVLDIRDIHVETDTARLDFSSRIRPDTAAMFGATVEADLSATAMDRMTEAINDLPFGGSRLSAGLAVIQAFGARDTNEEGDSVHNYQFEVTRDGMFMLNGNDMSPIMNLIR